VGRDEAPALEVVVPHALALDEPLEVLERLLRLRFHLGEEPGIDGLGPP